MTPRWARTLIDRAIQWLGFAHDYDPEEIDKAQRGLERVRDSLPDDPLAMSSKWAWRHRRMRPWHEIDRRLRLRLIKARNPREFRTALAGCVANRLPGRCWRYA